MNEVPSKEQILEDLKIPEVTYKLDRMGRIRPKTNIVYGQLRPILEKEKKGDKTK